MKQKLFIFSLLCLYATVAFSQARIIMPDSSKITTNPDSVKFLSKQAPPPKLANDSVMTEHDHDHDHDHEAPIDTVNLQLPAATVWRLNPKNGDRIVMPMDTARYNFQQTSIPDGYSVAAGYLAPIGSPFISKIFFDRDDATQFPFYEAYSPYAITPDKHLYFNTRVPYAQLHYQSAGSNRQKEAHFKALLTANINKKLNFGVEGEYLNARGFYNQQSIKHNNWKFFGDYISDRWEAHLFASTSTIHQFENGGITDERYIREPDSIAHRFITTDIPVKFQNTWNKLKTDNLLASVKYNLGYHEVLKKDSLGVTKGKFIPVASLSLISRYIGQDRRFLSHDSTRTDGIDSFYPKHYYNEAVDDSVTYSAIKNTFAISLREGFKPWVKFGLTGFIEHELRNFSMLDSVNGKLDRSKHRESLVTLGGILNKQQGENLRFDLQADVCLLGADLGALNLEGRVETALDIAGKRTTLTGTAYLRNQTPNFLQENYRSKYFWWKETFGNTRRAFLGGELFIPFTNTTLSVGVENLQNYIYLNKEKKMSQHADNVQVLMAKVDQRLRLGIFHWDNQVVYQTSSNQDVIPVPKLSVYSNMYLKGLLAKELTFQLGVDAHYHTKYFSPGYEPALLQFYNQQEREIGNYPIATAYANMHLKQTRFFVMFYNVASKFIKPREYFLLPGYPANPFLFKLGLSVDLHN